MQCERERAGERARRERQKRGERGEEEGSRPRRREREREKESAVFAMQRRPPVDDGCLSKQSQEKEKENPGRPREQKGGDRAGRKEKKGGRGDPDPGKNTRQWKILSDDHLMYTNSHIKVDKKNAARLKTQRQKSERKTWNKTL